MKNNSGTTIIFVFLGVYLSWISQIRASDSFEIEIECSKGAWKLIGELPIKKSSSHFAGYYTEWVNGSIIDSACKDHPDSVVRFPAVVERSKTQSFPSEGWGERSGKLYQTHSVRIIEKID